MKAICIKKYLDIEFGTLVTYTTGTATVTRTAYYNVETHHFLSIFVFKQHFRKFI